MVKRIPKHSQKRTNNANNHRITAILILALGLFLFQSVVIYRKGILVVLYQWQNLWKQPPAFVLTKNFFTETSTRARGDISNIIRVIQSPFFQQNISTQGTAITKQVFNTAAMNLPPGTYGGPMIPCDDSTNGKDSFVIKNNPNSIEASQVVTIIFTFSARYCNPDLRLFQMVWESHAKHLPSFLSMPKLFVFDGFGDSAVGHHGQQISAKIAQEQNQDLDEHRYKEFKRRLKEFVNQQQQNFNSTINQFWEEEFNVGPVKLLSKVMPTVTTPIVYVGQDDFALNVTLNTQSIVRTMVNAAMGYNNVRYILLAKDYPKSRLPYSFYGQRGVSPSAKIPLTQDEIQKIYKNNPQHKIQWNHSSICLHHQARKVGFFSDNNHFALTELYTKFLLPVNLKNSDKFVELSHQYMSINNPVLCKYGM